MNNVEKDIDIFPKTLTHDELLFKNQNLKTENKIFSEKIKSLEDQTKLQENKIKLQETEITYLKEQIEILKRAVFGKKSESFIITTKEQQSLDLDIDEVIIDVEDINEEKEVKNKKKRGGRLRVAKNIPIEKISIELPEEDRICGSCEKPMEEFGEDVSRKIEIIPAKIKIIETARKKYACECQEGVKISPLPSTAMPKCLATDSTLAHIAEQKYSLHTPLHRQQNYWKDHGIELSKKTMSNWMICLAKLFVVIVELMKEHLLDSGYVSVDETKLKIISSKTVSCMWTYTTGDRDARRITVFEAKNQKLAIDNADFLSGFKGILQHDGLNIYDWAIKNSDITSIGCMSHARRKFEKVTKAYKATEGIAYDIMLIFKKLYKIEEKITEGNFSIEQIEKQRDEASRPLIGQIYARLVKEKDAVYPKSLLGQAISYTLGQWPRLIKYLDNGRMRIDNNHTEREIKFLALGRKNWLFASSEGGAEANAVLYSISTSCKGSGISFYKYTKFILENFSLLSDRNKLKDFLPHTIDKKLFYDDSS